MDGLTEMIEHHDGNAASYVDAAMLQKLRIAVDERGTEAAAAAVHVNVHGARGRIQQPPPRSFVADHPFMFTIREDTYGTPLFIGVVLNTLLD